MGNPDPARGVHVSDVACRCTCKASRDLGTPRQGPIGSYTRCAASSGGKERRGDALGISVTRNNRLDYIVLRKRLCSSSYLYLHLNVEAGNRVHPLKFSYYISHQRSIRIWNDRYFSLLIIRTSQTIVEIILCAEEFEIERFDRVTECRSPRSIIQ